MRADDTVECHVLVIGSGGAGVRAAIEAEKFGDTVLVSKSLAGKGGCTPMAEGGYNAVLREEDSCVAHKEDTIRGGAYLNDPVLVDILVNEAPERFRELVSWGAVFDRTDAGEFAQRAFGGQRVPRTCYAGDRTGHEMMMTLLERLRASDVTVLQEFSVIDLLKREGRVVGAVGLDRNGDLKALQADSTVIATGGASRIYDISTNSATGTGDGFAMGYRAGAELIDMEMVQFHPTGAVYPYDARGRLITEAVRGEGGILVNSKGERFMQRYDPERMELSTRDVVARSIAREVAEGRGTPRAGVFLDVTHLPPEQIEKRLPLMLEQFLAFGIDIRKEKMEVSPTAHHFMGGMRITPTGETTVPGLFACGEAAGGVHGANRLGGNSLAETQVFGRRAGEAAGRAPSREIRIDARQLDGYRRKLEEFHAGGVNPVTVVKKLQEAMWSGAGIARNVNDLERTLVDVEKLSKKKLLAQTPLNRAECFTVQNMCLVASLVIRSALLRGESRGAHTRTDVFQSWDAANSPYGHTYISLHKAGIEERKVPG
ncbi:MAG TPA: fumarate reductase (CoM/CoB) subunit TfrA [Methanomicrobiales archaeon]|nr:fumarate reductase (CoM/CoB) subunit TfrA [Methanomicrobiales archaeon]